MICPYCSTEMTSGFIQGMSYKPDLAWFDEIGMIEQHQIFDLFMEQLALVLYNKALDDAQRWYKTQQDNLYWNIR